MFHCKKISGDRKKSVGKVGESSNRQDGDWQEMVAVSGGEVPWPVSPS